MDRRTSLGVRRCQRIVSVWSASSRGNYQAILGLYGELERPRNWPWRSYIDLTMGVNVSFRKPCYRFGLLTKHISSWRWTLRLPQNLQAKNELLALAKLKDATSQHCDLNYESITNMLRYSGVELETAKKSPILDLAVSISSSPSSLLFPFLFKKFELSRGHERMSLCVLDSDPSLPLELCLRGKDWPHLSMCCALALSVCLVLLRGLRFDRLIRLDFVSRD
ncbi:hypothetical protein ABW19_dt0201983 [Dactylella cylindrospora]|nr:hypothetical protein ABW19_dt0201983 [Dactylella cylindrospora]